MEPLEALALLCRYYFHLTSMHFRNYPYLIKYYGWLSNARHELWDSQSLQMQKAPLSITRIIIKFAFAPCWWMQFP